MKLVILESPFAHDPEEMVKYGRKCLKDSVGRDEAPIASHLLFTQAGVLDDTDQVERSRGIAAGHAWLSVAEACVVYTDYGITPGMKLGIQAARKYGVEVLYRTIGQGGLYPFDSDFLGTRATDYVEQGAEKERERIARELTVKAARLRFGQGCDLLGQIVEELADEVARPPEPEHRPKMREEPSPLSMIKHLTAFAAGRNAAFDPDLDDDVPF
jgi:hypothetical protein